VVVMMVMIVMVDGCSVNGDDCDGSGDCSDCGCCHDGR
jgi:hypothetical protein